MSNRARLCSVLAVSLALMPGLAAAHPGGPHVHGVLDGFAHPVTGLDHLAAMVAVGLIAARLGGRGLWLVPASFVGAMALGAGLAMAGLAPPLVEAGIAASLVVFGALVAVRARPPVAAMSLLVAGFALFHGFAHGMEAPADASGLSYMAGFILATALLHGAGVLAGLRLGGMTSGIGRLALRANGAATATLGLAFALHLV
jgi:urease accessory protein